MGTNLPPVPAAITTGTLTREERAADSSSTANAARRRDHVTTDVSFDITIAATRSHDSTGRRRSRRTAPRRPPRPSYARPFRGSAPSDVRTVRARTRASALRQEVLHEYSYPCHPSLTTDVES